MIQAAAMACLKGKTNPAWQLKPAGYFYAFFAWRGRGGRNL